MGKKSGSGTGMNKQGRTSESLETTFWAKILKFFDARIRDLGWKNFVFCINIPDPKHCFLVPKLLSFYTVTMTMFHYVSYCINGKIFFSLSADPMQQGRVLEPSWELATELVPGTGWISSIRRNDDLGLELSKINCSLKLQFRIIIIVV
jgi:hypothetical protein